MVPKKMVYFHAYSIYVWELDGDISEIIIIRGNPVELICHEIPNSILRRFQMCGFPLLLRMSELKHPGRKRILWVKLWIIFCPCHRSAISFYDLIRFWQISDEFFCLNSVLTFFFPKDMLFEKRVCWCPWTRLNQISRFTLMIHMNIGHHIFQRHWFLSQAGQ